MTITEASGMSLADRAHPIEGGADKLDTVAQELYGKPYRLLSDAEATAVWDEIEQEEEEEKGRTKEKPGTALTFGPDRLDLETLDAVRKATAHLFPPREEKGE